MKSALVLSAAVGLCNAFGGGQSKCTYQPDLGAIEYTIGNDMHRSKYGPDDTLGAINLLTPEKVLEATKLIKTGKTYGLAVVTSSTFPAFGERFYKMNVTHAAIDETLGFHEDTVEASIGVGSHIDGLAHISYAGKHYNGRTVEETNAEAISGVKHLSTAYITPMVTRGVVLDIAGLKGVDMLGPMEPIHAQDLLDAARRQKVCIGEGDVVLVHTGWLQKWTRDGDVSFKDTNPGITTESAQYLADLGVVAVGADTWGVDVFPPPEGEDLFGGHQILLVKYGVYIMENLDPKVLIDEGISEFFFSLGVPRLDGSVQTNINPVAIV